MRHFETRVPGKWVLAGEHSVLAGGSAVALPHPEFSLALRFDAAARSAEGLRIFPSAAEPVIRELLAELSLPAPSGTLRLESTIPSGAGMGSSAALCVALARLFASQNRIAEDEVRGFATRMEDHFHGKSSGMDVAAILAGGPIRFSMKEGARALDASTLPRFTFHDTGLRAQTRSCVAKVAELRLARPEPAREIDSRMSSAASAAADALVRISASGEPSGRDDAIDSLAHAMHEAHRCFVEWGLVPRAAEALREGLLSQGALAAKLTGAGDGGIMVALWRDKAGSQR